MLLAANVPRRSALADALVGESGYVEAPEILTVVRVAEFLTQNAELVDAWLSWSEDKRVSSGWYFTETPEGYVVGCYPDGPRPLFSGKTQACAEFVVREVAAIHENAR